MGFTPPNGCEQSHFMDICLVETNSGTYLRPESIHGILWLQTHFEDSHWEAIVSNKVILPIEDAKNLTQDAKAAGLRLNYLPNFSFAGQS